MIRGILSLLLFCQLASAAADGGRAGNGFAMPCKPIDVINVGNVNN